MGISLKPENLKRYKDLAWLFMNYGHSNLIRTPGLGLEDLLEADDENSEAVSADADELTLKLEKMGPTFVKLGQILSTRPDLLPIKYVEALTRLQDKVEPFPYEEAESIITAELGVRISKAFADFDPTSDRSSIARTGPQGHDARWPAGSGKSPAAGDPRTGDRRSRRTGRDRSFRRQPH